MSGVKIIKAVDLGDKAEPSSDKTIKRVAAYCRVSTDEADQLVSYSSQIKYYTGLISERSDWQMAGIYADRAITGTLAFKRDQFQKLIRDCEARKIDMVITKSISRFARNVADVLKYVRILKKLGISVYFEDEKLDTLSMDGEMVLSVLGAVCQQEAENISTNVAKGLKMKMMRGELVGYTACLGYDYDIDTKKLVINEEEAELVKYIFRRYLDGAGAKRICKELVELGARTKHDKFKWSQSTIMRILQNEKYVGDLVQGKSYVVNPITKQRAVNRGEKDMYLVSDDHPSIISRDDFAKVQEIRKTRTKYAKKPSVPGRLSPTGRRYAFSHMMTCGFCGALFVRRCTNAGKKFEKTVWNCSHKIYHGKNACSHSRSVRDTAIKDAFVISFNRIKGEPPKELMESFLEIARKVLTNKQNNVLCIDAEKRLSDINAKLDKILDMKVDGLIDEDTYKRKFDKLQYSKKHYMKVIEENKNEVDADYDIEARIEGFRKIIESNPDLHTFSREIFDSMIDRIVIGAEDENGANPYIVKFVYSNGYEDVVDTTDMNSIAGKMAKKKATIPEKSEIPFNGTKEMVDRQKGLLDHLLKQGVLNQVTYNESVAKIEQTINKARTIANSCGG